MIWNLRGSDDKRLPFCRKTCLTGLVKSEEQFKGRFEVKLHVFKIAFVLFLCTYIKQP